MPRDLFAEFTMGSTGWSAAWADRDDPALAPDEDGDGPAEGVTLVEERLILIRRDVPKSAFPSVFTHELGHAGVYESGVGHVARISNKLEEQILYAIMPLVAQALITGGFWKAKRSKPRR